MKTAISTVSLANQRAVANILFDEGAQCSFITRELADKLHACPQQTKDIQISTFGGEQPTSHTLETVTINIESITGEKIPVSVLVVPKIATPLQNRIRTNVRTLPYLKGTPLAHPITSDEKFEVSLLIGADHYWEIVQDHIIRGAGPTAMESKLGYLLSGPLPLGEAPSNTTMLNVITMPHHQVESMDPNRFWDPPPLDLLMTPTETNDQTAIGNFKETNITRSPDGTYCARFPWRTDHRPLPSNYAVCAKRTRLLARRLGQDPKLLKTYSDIIAEQEEKAFIEKVSTTNMSDKIHYIPHHPVKKDSTTTPIRIVYDCSCRQSTDHPSLNDCLLSDPPLLNDMCSILLRFQTHPFAFSTDIEKAFLHVQLHEDDRDCTRFLWLSQPDDPESVFEAYRFKVVLFGATCSPLMLSSALESHLDQYSSTIATDMKENLYVDNLISGQPTENDVTHYYKSARSIMSKISNGTNHFHKN